MIAAPRNTSRFLYRVSHPRSQPPSARVAALTPQTALLVEPVSPAATSAWRPATQTSRTMEKGSGFAATKTRFHPAQSVSVASHTRQSHAMPPSRGTGGLTHSQSELINCYMPENPASKSAPDGKGSNALSDTHHYTSAPAAAPILTEPNVALVLRDHQTRTPYIADAWEFELLQAGLLDRFHKIPPGIRHGFIVDFPQIKSVQSPPNKDTVNTYSEQFNSILDKEINKGRYLGPFPLKDIEAALGPFQSSPLSLIPKPGRPGKYRLIQNFSFPITPSAQFPNRSINAHIKAENFPTTWGKFSVIYSLIARLPPGSEAATRDIAEAYRTIPLHRSQWPAGVVRISDTLGCIDTCLAFGATPSAGSYGHMSDAGCEILRAYGIGPVDKWVDDHIFFRIRRPFIDEYNKAREYYHDIIKREGLMTSGSRIWFKGTTWNNDVSDEFGEDCSRPIIDLSRSSPRSEHDSQFSYGISDIDAISLKLGIPWELEKDQLFGLTTIYLGFLWNLDKRIVSLSPEKTRKYLLAIAAWQTRRFHTLQDTRELFGKLLHACSVLPAGRAYLTGFERMLKIGADKPFVPHRPDKYIKADLDWWTSALSSKKATRSIVAPVNFSDIRAFSDASSETGIGLVVGDRWRAWRLSPDWKTRNGQKDIGWAEALGFELLVYTVAAIPYVGECIILYGDNTGVVEGWRNGRHRNHEANQCFKRIHEFIGSLSRRFEVYTKYVPSKLNPADGPSRGHYGLWSQLLPEILIPEPVRSFLIDASPFETSNNSRGPFPEHVLSPITPGNPNGRDPDRDFDSEVRDSRELRTLEESLINEALCSGQ